MSTVGSGQYIGGQSAAPIRKGNFNANNAQAAPYGGGAAPFNSVDAGAFGNTGGFGWAALNLLSGLPMTGEIDNNNRTGSGSSYSTQDLSGLNQSESLLNNSLGRLDGQLANAWGNIENQYTTRTNELESALKAAKQGYENSSTQNQQSLRTNKNQITDQASSGLRGLMRMLGAYGAVGSDLNLAGGAVADQASQQRAGAGQTFAENQQNLDTNWGTYGTQHKNEESKVSDWRTQQRNAIEQQSLTTRQDLLQKLASVRSQRGTLLGGGQVNAQGLIDQANGLSGRIDELGKVNPTYSGVTPTYQAPSLSSYTSKANTTSTDGGVPTGDNQYLNLLLGNKDKKTIF